MIILYYSIQFISLTKEQILKNLHDIIMLLMFQPIYVFYYLLFKTQELEGITKKIRSFFASISTHIDTSILHSVMPVIIALLFSYIFYKAYQSKEYDIKKKISLFKIVKDGLIGTHFLLIIFSFWMLFKDNLIYSWIFLLLFVVLTWYLVLKNIFVIINKIKILELIIISLINIIGLYIDIFLLFFHFPNNTMYIGRFAVFSIPVFLLLINNLIRRQIIFESNLIKKGIFSYKSYKRFLPNNTKNAQLVFLQGELVKGVVSKDQYSIFSSGIINIPSKTNIECNFLKIKNKYVILKKFNNNSFINSKSFSEIDEGDIINVEGFYIEEYIYDFNKKREFIIPIRVKLIKKSDYGSFTPIEV